MIKFYTPHSKNNIHLKCKILHQNTLITVDKTCERVLRLTSITK